MAKSICFACGATKTSIAGACRRCGISPRGDAAALAKSLYLSIDRFDDPDEQSRYSHELDAIGDRIGRHEPVEFDESELRRMDERIRLLSSVTRGRFTRALSLLSARSAISRVPRRSFAAPPVFFWGLSVTVQYMGSL